MTSGQPSQLPFDLGHREAFTREDFWVSSSNADAVSWIDRWPEWGAPGLVIYGATGCGKSHLAHVFATLSNGRAHIFDDADLLVGKPESEEKLFHLYNAFTETGRHLLLTGKTPPRDWPFILPDLRSRIQSLPAVQVGAPDDHLCGILVAKLFSDRQIFVPQEVVQYILSRAERSFGALRRLVGDIDRLALSRKKPVTIPLVKEILQRDLL